MTVVIGPVLKRADGYEFDTWTAGKEVARGYRYRRIEDAHYARNADIKASAQGRAPAAIVCQTLDEFIVKLTEDGYPINDVYLAAKTPWLQRQLHNPLGLGDRPFVVGRRPVAGEELPPRQPDLMLDDTGPFRLSRNHFLIEQRMKLIMCATSAAPLEQSSTVSPSAITSAPMMFYCELERMKWLPGARGRRLSSPCPYLDRWCLPRVGPAKRPRIPRVGH